MSAQSTEEEEKAVLRINVADMTDSEKVPPLIYQLLLADLPFPSTKCPGKMVDDCYAETIAPKGRADAIADILKSKGVRAEVKRY